MRSYKAQISKQFRFDMKILVLSPFFFPEQISTGKYNTHLVEELTKQGASVTVYSSHPLFPQWKISLSTEKMDGVEIRRGGGWIRYPSSTLLRRAVLEIWFSLHVVKSWLFKRGSYDVIVPIFPPSLFFFVLCIFLSRSSHKIGIIHDLQGVYANLSKGFIGRILTSLIGAIESSAFNSCDRLIFLSNAMANRAKASYGISPEKCTVCYPFVSIPSQTIAHGSNLLELFPPNIKHVVYSGALGDKQNPALLYDFFNALTNAEKNIDCHIFSGGPHFESLKTRFFNANERIHFHDLVHSRDLEELYARSDVQIIPQQFGTGDGSLPSKLPNLMAAGVPVFVICESGSEVGDIVVKAQAGGISTCWDADSLVTSFQSQMGTLFEEDRIVRRARLQAFVRNNFNIESVANILLLKGEVYEN